MCELFCFIIEVTNHMAGCIFIVILAESTMTEQPTMKQWPTMKERHMEYSPIIRICCCHQDSSLKESRWHSTCPWTVRHSARQACG